MTLIAETANVASFDANSDRFAALTWAPGSMVALTIASTVPITAAAATGELPVSVIAGSDDSCLPVARNVTFWVADRFAVPVILMVDVALLPT